MSQQAFSRIIAIVLIIGLLTCEAESDAQLKREVRRKRRRRINA